ncbi:hypothetical protein CLOP_g10915, partial [Closterium sp. NIES-67]
KCVIIYLDDILIYSRSREQHLKDLDAVFTLLHKNRLITKGSKCDFLKQELEFLGHVVSTEGVKIDPRKIKTIQEWKPPTNLKELQSFLGFVNYVRRFIPNMAGLSAPLTDRLKDHDCFWWGEKQQAAFDQLKIALTSPPVLRISDPNRPYEVVTDASDIAMVQFSSRTSATVHDKEMLAIVHAFKTWRCYLTGADVTVRTDHKSLQYLRAQPNLNPRQIRWLDFLESNFHYTITYKRGANNIADALTRPTVHTAAILSPRPTHYLRTIHPRLQDRSFFRSAIHQQHTTATGPYFYKRVRVLLHCLPDHEIVASASSRTTTAVGSPERPWQHVTMDYVTGLPAGPSGNDAILVVVDRLTKMAHFIACQQTITAEQTAQLFITNVIRLHGLPSAIISDRDPKFTRISGATCGTNSAPNSNFIAYHPQTDGQTERVNQTMEQLIRTTCTDPSTWEKSFCYSNSRIITRPQPQPINPHFFSTTDRTRSYPLHRTSSHQCPGPRNLLKRFSPLATKQLRPFGKLTWSPADKPIDIDATSITKWEILSFSTLAICGCRSQANSDPDSADLSK